MWSMVSTNYGRKTFKTSMSVANLKKKFTSLRNMVAHFATAISCASKMFTTLALGVDVIKLFMANCVVNNNYRHIFLT
jgi:hypothetical protein